MTLLRSVGEKKLIVLSLHISSYSLFFMYSSISLLKLLSKFAFSSSEKTILYLSANQLAFSSSVVNSLPSCTSLGIFEFFFFLYLFILCQKGFVDMGFLNLRPFKKLSHLSSSSFFIWYLVKLRRHLYFSRSSLFCVLSNFLFQYRFSFIESIIYLGSSWPLPFCNLGVLSSTLFLLDVYLYRTRMSLCH